MARIIIRQTLEQFPPPNIHLRKGEVSITLKILLKENNKNESPVRDPSEVICFNCDQAGHYRKGRAAPRKLSCYKCKTVGFNCPKFPGNAREKQ